MTDASRVLVAVRVPATPARAFAAFTTEIGQWWRPNGLFEFSPGRTDGTLAFEPGPAGRLVEHYPDGAEFVVGEVRLWEPPHRLVLSWRQVGLAPHQETELHVRFDAVEPTPGDVAATRVVVEHYGWDRIPMDHAVRHGLPLAVIQLRFADWWQSLLAALASQAAIRPS